MVSVGGEYQFPPCVIYFYHAIREFIDISYIPHLIFTVAVGRKCIIYNNRHGSIRHNRDKFYEDYCISSAAVIINNQNRMFTFNKTGEKSCNYQSAAIQRLLYWRRATCSLYLQSIVTHNGINNYFFRLGDCKICGIQTFICVPYPYGVNFRREVFKY